MTWELATVAGAVLLVAGVSRRLVDTPFTPAMAFTLLGLFVGPLVIGEITVAPSGANVRTLAEATLAVVLFADASRIKLRVLRREYAVPLRLLGIGLPLTIVMGALLAAAIFPHLSVAEVVVLAVLLAPTDAALGQAVVTEPRLPSRIRQGLNVESGLNDGICVPLLLIALGAADVEDKMASSHHAISIVAEEIGYGILGGVGAGLADHRGDRDRLPPEPDQRTLASGDPDRRRRARLRDRGRARGIGLHRRVRGRGDFRNARRPRSQRRRRA